MKVAKIVLLGAGNVAVHLAGALSSAGCRIVQVYSRTLASAQSLAAEVNAEPITDLGAIDSSADVFLFALNDSGLESIINQISFSGQLALHTSGSMPMDVFNGKALRYGVLYPLQTFSRFRPVDFKSTPFFVEANSAEDLLVVEALALRLSPKVIHADSFRRKQLHLSAVFANNFVNHLYVISAQLLEKSGFLFDVLKPLILETAMKAIELDNPATAQTGPAARNNREVMNDHIEMLASNPDWQNLYTFVSNSIVKMLHEKADNL
ncbi:MAG: DUF2520 domain-containing protein [Bacteroidota bacterium]|nr:DUF2520 domain-containing protein [Bacteroidota bacterium]